MGLSLGELYVVVSAKTAGFHSSMTAVNTTIASVGKSATQLGTTLTSRVTLPLLAASGVAAKLGKDFSAAFELTNTMMKLTGEEAVAFKMGVLDLSSQMGMSASDMMAAGYKISSVLHTSAEDTVTIMKAATIAAKAGKISVVSANEAIVNSMSIYGIQAEKTMDVVDMLAKTVQLGNASWEDAANILPRIYGIAKPLGVSIEEASGAFALMSGKAGNAAEASTALVGVLTSLMKPSEDMRVALDGIAKKLGVHGKATAQNIIQQKGFGAIMQALAETIDGDADKMGKLIPNIRGLKGASGLMEDTGKKLNMVLGEMGDKAGEANKQIAAGFGPAQRMTEAWNRVKTAFIKAWQVMEPGAVRFTGKLGDMAVAFTNMDAQVQKNIVTWGLYVAAIGPALLITGKLVTSLTIIPMLLKLLVSALVPMKLAFGVFAPVVGILAKIGSVLGLLLNPWVLIAAAVGVVAFKVAKALGVVKDFKSMILRLKITAVRAFDSMVPSVVVWARQVWKYANKALDFIVQFATKGVEWIAKWADKGINQIAKFIRYLTNKFPGVMDGLKISWIQLSESVSSFVTNALGYLSNFSANNQKILDYVRRNWRNAFEDIGGMIATFQTNIISNIAQLAENIAPLAGAIMGALADSFTKFLAEVPGLVAEGLKKMVEIFTKAYTMRMDAIKSLFKGVKGVLTGKGFDLGDSLSKTLPSAIQQYIEAALDPTTVEERWAKIDLTKGLKKPLEGFKSSMEALPAFDLKVNPILAGKLPVLKFDVEPISVLDSVEFEEIVYKFGGLEGYAKDIAGHFSGVFGATTPASQALDAMKTKVLDMAKAFQGMGSMSDKLKFLVDSMGNDVTKNVELDIKANVTKSPKDDSSKSQSKTKDIGLTDIKTLLQQAVARLTEISSVLEGSSGF